MITKVSNTKLYRYYPASLYETCEVKSRKDIKQYCFSEASCCWTQRPIDGTAYYLLAIYSPEHYGEKQLILVCKKSALATMMKTEYRPKKAMRKIISRKLSNVQI